MSQALTKKAIVKAVMNRVAALNPAVPIAWPNVKFAPPNEEWLKFSYMPSGTSSETLGIGGEDELRGIFQIDVNTKTNTGDKNQELILRALEAYFVPGKIFTYQTQSVTFVSCNRSTGRIVDSFYRVSLSVSFYSRYFRPAP